MPALIVLPRVTAMVRSLIVFALLVVSTASAATTGDTRQEKPASRLLIDAVAFDRRGLPVNDLKPDEIEVWIGGFRVPIEELGMPIAAQDERSQRAITLVIDDITQTPVGVGRSKEIARRFLNRLAPGDHLSVIPLSGGVGKSSDDRVALGRGIDAINIRATGFTNPADLAAHVLNSLEAIARQLSEATAQRRLVVGIGPAWIFDTPIPPPMVGRDLRPEWTSATRAMALSNVTLYVIDPGGVGSAPPRASDSFARDTGGHAFVNTNDPNPAVERIMREAVSYYTIVVLDPPRFKTADLRELDVRVKRQAVTLRARRLIAGRR